LLLLYQGSGQLFHWQNALPVRLGQIRQARLWRQPFSEVTVCQFV
jgi:hypothetical protein